MESPFIEVNSHSSPYSIKMKNELIESLNETSNRIGNESNWILYDQNFVMMGRGKDALLRSIKDPETIKELRFFSKLGEFHLWLYNGELKGRLRIDGEGRKSSVYKARHFTWAARQGQGDYKNIRLNIDQSLQSKDAMQYLVYNYYDFDEQGFIQFYDARLVEFIGKKGV